MELPTLLVDVGVPIGAVLTLWWSIHQSIKHIERHVHDAVHKELERHCNGEQCNGE